MTNQDIILASLGLALVLVILILIWLVFAYAKLKRELQNLKDYAERNHKDIAGLCSAAITVDTRLQERDQLIKELQQKLTQLNTVETTAQPYHSVIQKVRSGADLNELMQNCGLSRDEAALLIRLHGKQER